MIFSKRGASSRSAAGYYNLEGTDRRRLFGHGDGDYVRLRDEYGNMWRGVGEFQQDGSVRYSFRDETGRSISGFGDANGIILRDDKGNSWRGYVD